MRARCGAAGDGVERSRLATRRVGVLARTRGDGEAAGEGWGPRYTGPPLCGATAKRCTRRQGLKGSKGRSTHNDMMRCREPGSELRVGRSRSQSGF
eukprot:84712-Prymnesium_polylepis.1